MPGLGRHQEVQGQQQVGRLLADRVGRRRVRRVGVPRAVRRVLVVAPQPQVGHDRAYLLAEPGLVKPGHPRPSRNAAVASTWLSMTTPVPPMPVDTSEYPPAAGTVALSAGSGRSAGRSGSGRGLSALGGGDCTVTNEGQSPSRQL